MIWGDFKTLVKNKVSRHAISYVSLTNIAVGQPFDTEANRYLRMFCRETEELYAPKLAIVIGSGASSIDLSSNVVVPTSEDVYEPHILWIENRKVTEVGMTDLQVVTNLPNAAAGKPLYWALNQQYQVYFDRATGAVYSGCYVAGLYDHPALTSDATALLLPEADVDCASDYVARFLCGPAVADRVGQAAFERLQDSGIGGARRILGRNRANRTPVIHKGDPAWW